MRATIASCVLMLTWTFLVGVVPASGGPPAAQSDESLFDAAVDAKDADGATALAARLAERARTSPNANATTLAAYLRQLANRITAIDRTRTATAALDLLGEAAQLLAAGPSVRERLEVLSELSDLYYDTGNWRKCEETDRQVLQLRRELLGNSHIDVALTQKGLALGLYRQGRYTAAEVELLEAIGTLEGLDPPAPAHLADTLGHLAEALRALNRYDEAEALFERGLTLGPSDRAAFLSNMSGLYRDMNRYSDARWRLTQALRAEEDNSNTNLRRMASFWNNMAEVARLQGDWPEAEGWYQKAVETGRLAFGPTHPRVGTYLNQWAELLREQARYDDAETLYREALRIKQAALGPDHPDVAYTHQGLGLLFEQSGRLEEAEGQLRKAAAIRHSTLGAQHPDFASALLDLADSLAKVEGRNIECRTLVEQAARVLEATPAEGQSRARAYALWARLLWTAGERRTAIEKMGAALALIEHLRPGSGGSGQSRARFFSRHAAEFRRMAAWLVEDGQPDRAFEVLEGGRARALLDELVSAHIDVASGIDPEERSRLKSREHDLLKRVALVREELAGLQVLSGESPSPRAQERRELLERLETEFAGLNEDIQSASRFGRAFGTQSASQASPERVQQDVVPAGGVLLEYAIGPDVSFVVLVPERGGRIETFPLHVTTDQAAKLHIEVGPLKADHLRRVVLGPADGARDGLAQQLASPALSPRRARTRDAQLHALWQVVMPAALWQRVRRARELVAVLDDALSQLPFESLVVQEGAGIGATRYWLDEGPPVRYAASAATLLALRDRTRSTNTAILSVSNPDFGVETANTIATGSENDAVVRGSLRLVRLPGTAREGQRVVEAYGGDDRVITMALERARESSVRRVLPDARVIHLATHGVVDSSRGELFAALALSPPVQVTDPEDDGLLQLHEVYGLRLNAELAVLSACEGRIGPTMVGEGSFALSRGFLAAGARRVVASLWAAEDQATAELVGSFLSEVAQGERRRVAPDYAGALAQAKRRVRRRSTWADPFYWAGFVLEGVP